MCRLDKISFHHLSGGKRKAVPRYQNNHVIDSQTLCQFNEEGHRHQYHMDVKSRCEPFNEKYDLVYSVIRR